MLLSADSIEHNSCIVHPAWPAPRWVGAAMSTRAGGQSQPPWSSLNLGDHVGDAPGAVAANRLLWQQACAVQPVYLEQVHGCTVVSLDAPVPAGRALQADGCFASVPGVGCTVMVADCLPVLVCHAQQRIVGAAHAGWRSLAGVQGWGVIEALLHAMRAALVPASAGDDGWMAWLGPCIGPQAFEVGDEVRAAFVNVQPQAAGCFVAGVRAGKWLADLAALARLRLAAAGVRAIYGNDGTAAWCTFGQPQRYFSYRRDGCTGRMAATIWLRGAEALQP